MSVLRSQTGLKPLSTPTCSFTLDMYLKTWDCECVELYRVCVRQRQVRLIAVARQNVTLSDNHIFNILLNFTGEERTGSWNKTSLGIHNLHWCTWKGPRAKREFKKMVSAEYIWHSILDYILISHLCVFIQNWWLFKHLEWTRIVVYS